MQFLVKKVAPCLASERDTEERDTERVRTLRTAFRETVQALDVHRLTFVDKSGSNLAMTHRYGRATPGQRVVESIPTNYGNNYTMQAALSLEGLNAPWGVDMAVNGAIFGSGRSCVRP